MSDTPRLPTRPPHRTIETAGFWDACAAGRFVLPRCDACGELVWYPRLVCPTCGSHSVSPTEVSGRGTVYSWSVVRRGGPGPFRDSGPYVLAMIELDEGPRLLSNVVECHPDEVEVGMRVEVVFEPVDGSEDRIYRFAPVP